MRQIILFLFVLFMISTSAKAQILFGGDWKEGCYYDLQGNKITGLLHSDPPTVGAFGTVGKSDHILYKANKKGDRQRLSSDSIKAFVIEQDSFVVSHSAKLRKPFLQVIINESLKLYFSTVKGPTYSGPSTGGVPSSAGSGMVGAITSGITISYYYGPNPDEITELNRKDFIEVMSKIMEDKPKVVETIKNKTYKFGSIQYLITYYKTGKTPNFDDAY